MISDKEFCTNHIESLRRPGGEALVKSNTSTDSNRPLIYATLIQNGAYLDIGKLHGRIIGLELDYGDTVYESDCYTYDCFYETGVWTQGVKTPYSRNNSGLVEYWIRGPLDEGGNTYSVDIGFIYKPCQETSIVDENIPLSYGSYFTSRLNVKEGSKFVRLNKISPFLSTPVLHHIGEFQKKDHLSRGITGYLLEYKYSDQRVDLEEIAVSISSLLMSNYYRPIPSQLVFRDSNYSDPSIKETIESNLSRLSRLVDTNLNSKRYGSIPRWPATYSEPEDIYGPSVDISYQHPEVRLFDIGCYEEDCFTVSTNKTLIDREVNNRAMAWLLYSYILHKLTYVTDTYDSTISAIGTYLISQIEPGFNLITEGWLHSNNYRDSERITTFILKTNVVTFLALLKAYDATSEQQYLDKAADLCEGIITYLFNTKNKQFFDSYEDRIHSIESNTYGLLFAWTLGRADILEYLITYFYSLIKDPSQVQAIKPISDSLGNLVVDTLTNEVVTVSSFLGNVNQPSSLSIFNTTSSYSYIDILRVNTIATEILESAALDNYVVPFSNILTQVNNAIRDYLYGNRNNISLLLASSCTLDRPLYQYEPININHKEDLYTTKFYRSFWYERFRDMWPLNYTWVSDFARSPKGVLGSILRGMAKASSNLFTQIRRVETSSFLDLAHDIYLNEWGEDLKIPRRFKESDSQYRSRIKYIVSKLNSTESSIKDYLSILDIKDVVIEENWKDILTFDSPNIIGSSSISEAYLAGNNYSSSNVSRLICNQPIPLEIHNELDKVKAFGTKFIYEETLCLPIESTTLMSSCGVEVSNIGDVYVLSHRSISIANSSNLPLINVGTSSTGPWGVSGQSYSLSFYGYVPNPPGAGGGPEGGIVEGPFYTVYGTNNLRVYGANGTQTGALLSSFYPFTGILFSSITAIPINYQAFYLNDVEIYRTTDSIYESYVVADPNPVVYVRHRPDILSPWTTWQSGPGTPNWSKAQGVNTYKTVDYTLLNPPVSGISNTVNPGNYAVTVPNFSGTLIDWAAVGLSALPNTISIISMDNIGYLLNDVVSDINSIDIDPDLVWLEDLEVLDGTIYDSSSYTLSSSDYGRIRLK